ncbi:MULTISPECIES: zf-HC2 domain-containing protein [Marinobacter]|jgi:predicted anti-sigma-YlaC factor YlaD|uniref:zf-HC2 domain-containing protein n=1 Tax=Marinobacter TaxID=2742 RepID=UPI0007D90C79|nr:MULTISPECIES: zf-HC2 domain-containing protein [unclassified Marinobacter]MBL3823728.1 zf-HC2 domain-containing protein [Marinobacter sp. MC3]MBL3891884.1 zf-HC2 domain-containing protein [Marinobacter sp. MW3]OAN88286.1 transcriptional regulator [Marinobacter sp. EhN04]OAN91269.1 transcriptional regulator [Marinobacter sp. EhC06]
MLMCRDLAVIASDYIDGELPVLENMSVKMHLMMCKDCRTFIGNLRASTDMLNAHSSGQADEELIRKIDERVALALKEGSQDPTNQDPD